MVLSALNVNDRGASLDAVVATRAHVESLLVAIRAIVTSGMILEKVVVQQLLVAR